MSYENIDEYYEDDHWDLIYDDPMEDCKYEMYEYLSWLSSQEDEYDDLPF